MAFERVKSRLGRASLPSFLAVLASLAPCAGAWAANPLGFGPVDANSSVAADVQAAQRSPGPYPSFSQIPPVPKDVRPALAWRASVTDAWTLKRQTEAEAAAIPFGLEVGDAPGWADAERSKIPPAEMIPPPADATDQAEAFAAAAQARATPPPPQK
jgi:hypothetical protein